MDANGLRFWMLSAGQDWLPPAGSPDLQYCAEKPRLILRSRLTAQTAAENFAIATSLLKAAPFARDPYGNYARWDAASGHVVAGGSGPGEVPIYSPPPLESVSDLALGYDGVLYVAIAGQLVLIDRLNRWPDFTFQDPNVTFWRLAAHPQGGVIVLDNLKPQLVRIQGLPLGDLPPRPANSGVLRPCAENENPPRITESALLPSGEYFVAIAEDGNGNFGLLSWGKNDPSNDQVWFRQFSTLASMEAAQALGGVSYPYSLAWVQSSRIGLLATVNAQAFTYDLDETAKPLPPGGDSYVLSGLNPGPFAHVFGSPPYYNVGNELIPLFPVSFNSFAANASAQAQHVIDGGEARTTWHRLYLEAVLPPRCGAVVWLAATDKQEDLKNPNLAWFPHVFGDAPPPAGFDQVPRGVWLREASEVPFYPGLLSQAPQENRSGLFMALVQRAGLAVRALRGRYLAVRLDLSGDQRSTPEIAALRIYGPRFSYVDHYLPEIYREDTYGPEADLVSGSTRPDFLERFIDIFERPMTQIEDRIASAYLLTHPESTPDDSLDWLGSWIGVDPDPAPADRRRARLQATPKLYRERGTVTGIRDAVDVATNGLCSRGAVVLLEAYRLRHTFATVLGSNLGIRGDPLLPGYWESANSFVGDTLLLGDEHKQEFLALFESELLSAAEQQTVAQFYDALANRLTVFIHDQVETVDQQVVARVVEREKPAHVAVTLKRASRPFLIGIASLLGINSYLTPEPSKEQATVNQSRLGRWAFVGHLPSLDPRLEDSRAASEFEQPIARISAPQSVITGQPIALDGSASLAPEGRTITDYRWVVLSPNP